MSTETFDQWSIVELMGHVRVAGRLTEEEHFGAKLGRIDIPQPKAPCKTCNGGGKVLPLETGSTCPDCIGTGFTGGGMTTQYFGGSAVFRITPTTEEIARSVAASCQPAPLSRWELPSLPAPDPVDHDPDDYEDGDDDD